MRKTKYIAEIIDTTPCMNNAVVERVRVRAVGYNTARRIVTKYAQDVGTEYRVDCVYREATIHDLEQ